VVFPEAQQAQDEETYMVSLAEMQSYVHTTFGFGRAIVCGTGTGTAAAKKEEGLARLLLAWGEAEDGFEGYEQLSAAKWPWFWQGCGGLMAALVLTTLPVQQPLAVRISQVVVPVPLRIVTRGLCDLRLDGIDGDERGDNLDHHAVKGRPLAQGLEDFVGMLS
jgi:hypothetical protein